MKLQITRGIADRESPLAALQPIFLHQMHSSRCVCVESPTDYFHEADAMITHLSNYALCIKHADCQAALFFDPAHEIIGAAHAGWRGLVSGVYSSIVRGMEERYQTRPVDLQVWIGPSLCLDHSEFCGYRDYFPNSFLPFQMYDNHFDLKAIAADQLRGLGILEKSLTVSSECTFCNDKYYSYRRDKADPGRNISWICKIVDERCILDSCSKI